MRRPPSIFAPLAVAAVCAFSSASVFADAPKFENVFQGAAVEVGIGTSQVGDDLLGQIGGESEGIRTYSNCRCILQWDALAAVEGGVLANEHPYFGLIGGHALGSGELGMPFGQFGKWSFYSGLRLDGDFQALVPPGDTLASLKGFNDMDGVGGIVATGDARVAAGMVWLDGDSRLLLLSLFVQEALHAPETNTAGEAFTEGGISARFDIARQLTAQIEAEWGRSVAVLNSALAATDQKAHLGGAASVRWAFHRGMWLTGNVSLSQESDHVIYSASGVSFDTFTAPTFAFSLGYGFMLPPVFNP